MDGRRRKLSKQDRRRKRDGGTEQLEEPEPKCLRGDPLGEMPLSPMCVCSIVLAALRGSNACLAVQRIGSLAVVVEVELQVAGEEDSLQQHHDQVLDEEDDGAWQRGCGEGGKHVRMRDSTCAPTEIRAGTIPDKKHAVLQPGLSASAPSPRRGCASSERWPKPPLSAAPCASLHSIVSAHACSTGDPGEDNKPTVD